MRNKFTQGFISKVAAFKSMSMPAWANGTSQAVPSAAHIAVNTFYNGEKFLPEVETVSTASAGYTREQWNKAFEDVIIASASKEQQDYEYEKFQENVTGVKIFPVGKEVKAATPNLQYCRGACIGILQNEKLVANAIIHYDAGDHVDKISEKIYKWCKENKIDREALQFEVRAVHEGNSSISTPPNEYTEAVAMDTSLDDFLKKKELGTIPEGLIAEVKKVSREAEREINGRLLATLTFRKGEMNALFSIDEMGNVSSVKLSSSALKKAAEEEKTVKAHKAKELGVYNTDRVAELQRPVESSIAPKTQQPEKFIIDADLKVALEGLAENPLVKFTTEQGTELQKPVEVAKAPKALPNKSTVDTDLSVLENIRESTKLKADKLISGLKAKQDHATIATANQTSPTATLAKSSKDSGRERSK